MQEAGTELMNAVAEEVPMVGTIVRAARIIHNSGRSKAMTIHKLCPRGLERKSQKLSDAKLTVSRVVFVLSPVWEAL